MTAIATPTLNCGNAASAAGTITSRASNLIYLLNCTTGPNPQGYTVNAAVVELGAAVAGSIEVALYNARVSARLCTVAAGQPAAPGLNTVVLTGRGCNDPANTANGGVGLSANTTYKIALAFSNPLDLRLTSAGSDCTVGVPGSEFMQFPGYNSSPAVTFPLNSIRNQPWATKCAFRLYLSLSAAGGPTPTPSVSVAVSPSSAGVWTGATQQFTASVTGTSNTTVSWKASAGTISSSGLYTAPQSAGTYTVTATSMADNSKSGSAQVTAMTPPASVGITLSPSSSTLQVGANQQFTASVTGTSNTTVTWKASAGTITKAGLYTAPQSAGTYTVTATTVADTTKSASALVTVNSSPSVIGISISPSGASLQTGASQQFTASLSGTSNTGVTWKATAGTITTIGVYTAPQSAGTYTVTATSVADTTKSASALVSVTQPTAVVGITLSPASTGLPTGASQQFIASVTGTTNTSVTWNATAGTITSNGFYTAPQSAGTYTVTATSVADTSKSASALVTVLGSSPLPAAGSPVLSFSDLSGGPATGNTDTSKGQASGVNGAIVSVWGTNLGSSQGSSTITVGGLPPSAIYYWGDAIRQWSVANLHNGYQNMQVIIFQVPAGASNTGIRVTVNRQQSNTLPFSIANGRFFFACGTPDTVHGQTTCSDSNPGSWTQPKGTIAGVKNAATEAGDIAYVENATPQGNDVSCAGAGALCMSNPGTALIGYPGAISQVGSVGVPDCGNNGGVGFHTYRSGYPDADHITVAKLDARGGTMALATRGDNNRWVALTASAPNLNLDTGGVYVNGSNVYLLGLETFNVGLLCQLEGGPGICGGNDAQGNYCGTSADNRTFAHVYYITGRRGQATAAVESNRHIEWNYVHDNLNGSSMAFNIFQSNEGGGGGVPDIVKDFVIAHNVVKDQYHSGMQFSGIDGTNYIYDNLFINTGAGTGLTGVDSYNPGYGMAMRLGQGPNSPTIPSLFHVYNNTVYKAGCGIVNGSWCGNSTITSSSIYGCFIFEGTAGQFTPDLHNNICVQTDPNLPYMGSTGYAVNPTGSTQSSNNLWFNSGTAKVSPSFDTSAINQNPLFVSAGTNFRLQSTSPAVNSGSSLGAAFVTYDLDGNPQPSNGAFNIGAYAIPGAGSTGSTSALTISNVTSSNITSGGTTITWATSTGGTSQVEYGTTTSYGAMTSLNSNLVTSHAQSLSGLNAGTTYHYRVHSKDANNNDSVSGDFTFTTTAVVGSNVVISNVAANAIGTSGATIAWTTNTGASSQVEYGLSTAYGSSTTLDSTLVTNHSQTIGGLSASTTYHYQVASNGANGVTVLSNDFIFTTPAAAAGDVVTSAVNGIPSSSGATITWTTNQPASGYVEYGTTNSYGSSTSPDSNLSSHYQKISGLNASTFYHYRVHSKGSNGVDVVSGDSTFTTLSPTSLAYGWSQIGVDGNDALVNADDVSTPGVHVCPDHPYDLSIYGSSFIAGEGCQSVVQSYSGAALDTDTNQLIIWGGGHADYGGNEIYLLDFTSNPPKWHRAFGPTLPGAGNSSNNPSGCPNGLSGSSSYPALAGCVGGGQAPTSTHSVGGLTFIPANSDASGANHAEFFDFGGSRNSGSGGGDNRGWLYDLTTQPSTWTNLGILPLSNVDNLSNIAEWDPVDKVIYMVSTSGFGVYNPSATTTATRTGSCGAKCSVAARTLLPVNGVVGSTSENGAIDQAHRLMVIVWKGGVDQQGFNIDEVDLATGNTMFSGGTNRSTSLPGCPTNIGSASTGDTIYAPSVTYDPTINGGSIVIHNYPLDTNIYVWNHSTHSCTSETYASNSAESPANITPSKERGAVYGRFRYVPGKGYYIYQSEGDLAPFILCRNPAGCSL